MMVSKKRSENKPNPKISPRRLIFLIFILFSIAFVIMFILVLNKSNVSEVPVCGDGTFYDTCSLNKPYYCSEGVLVENASICGCPNELSKRGDFCNYRSQTNPQDVFLKYLLDGEEGVIPFTVYGGLSNYLSGTSYSIAYSEGEKPFRVDFKHKKINDENQRQLLLPLVVRIQNLAHDKDDQARIAISLVQHIQWGESNRTLSFGDNELIYSRYPYEVLFEEQGICGEKSELLSFLLRELGFDVVLFYFSEEDHEAVGIKCPVKYSFDNTGYCFVETSGPAIISDSSMEYYGGLVLTSQPELLRISEGISLSDNLEEYRDAKRIMRINRVTRRRGWIGPLWRRTLRKFEEKYGILETYNVG